MSHLTYNKETGLITDVNGNRVGLIIKNHRNHYLSIKFEGKMVQAHRLAFYLANGEWPCKALQVDHIDGNGLNNKFANLRLVTCAINQKNASLRADNKCGFTGVRYVNSTRGRRAYWNARIKVNRKSISLGCYDNLIDAVAARMRANAEHGFTIRHGR